MKKLPLYYFTDRPLPTQDSKINTVFLDLLSQYFEIFLLTDDPNFVDKTEYKKISVYNIYVKQIFMNNGLFKYALRAFKIKPIVSCKSLIIIRNNVYLAFFLLIMGFENVFLEINFPYWLFKPNRIEKYLLRYFLANNGGTIFLTESMQSLYFQRLKMKSSRSIVSGMGVNKEHLAVRNVSLDERIVDFVYIGTLSMERGFDVVFEALKLLDSQNVNLKIMFIGGSRSREVEEFSNLMTKYDFKNINITRKDWMSETELIKELSRCRYGLSFIKPEVGYRVSSPTKLLEYIANLVPPLMNLEIYEQRKLSGFFPHCTFDANSMAALIDYAFKLEGKEYLDLVSKCRAIRGSYSYELVNDRLLAELFRLKV